MLMEAKQRGKNPFREESAASTLVKNPMPWHGDVAQYGPVVEVGRSQN